MSPTVLTFERFRVGVSALVRFEIEHAAEIFATHVTAVRLFSRVCSHVYLENSVLGEAFVAVATDERFDAHV